MSYSMRIMVLNDGETWTEAAGCKLMEVPGDWDDATIAAALRDFQTGIGVPGVHLLQRWTEQIPSTLEGALSWLVDHVDDAPDVGDIINRVASSIRENTKGSV